MPDQYYKKIHGAMMAKPVDVWFDISKVPEYDRFVAQVKEYIDSGEQWEFSSDYLRVRRME